VRLSAARALLTWPYRRLSVDYSGGIVDSWALYGYRLRMKVREILAILRDDGWYLKDTEGSHRQYKHPVKSGRVTVSGKPNDDLPHGTLNSILKQAGLKK